MASVETGTLIARNPATGAEIGTVARTSTEDVRVAVGRACEAQAEWAARPLLERVRILQRWRQVLARDADGWADLIRDEIGKPRGEAMGGDVVASLDAIRWTLRNASRVLSDQRLGAGWQRWMLVPAGRLSWRPYGVIGMIGTWNYPLFLNAPPIAQALVGGNAVVWKPSELASRCGDRLRMSFEAAGIPSGVVETVQGYGDVGRALIDSLIDKGMFTGGIKNGRRVLGALGAKGIPAVAELSGFDAAIVLPDAPLSSTARALAWGAFVGCGQTCVAVKRVYVVGDASPWATALAREANALRVGDPKNVEIDVGPMITAEARDRFDGMVRSAISAGANLLAGGAPLPCPGWFYRPTVLLATTAAPESALEGAFGPIVVVRGVAGVDEAVAAANGSEYALAASVWSRDRGAARQVARRLLSGTVTINDAVTPIVHGAGPFGGAKGSGFGRTKGVLGLREFVQPQVTYERSPGGFRPWLFPYTPLLQRALKIYRGVFHRPG